MPVLARDDYCEGCLCGMLIIAKAVQVGSLETCNLEDDRLVEHRKMQQKSLKTNQLVAALPLDTQ